MNKDIFTPKQISAIVQGVNYDAWERKVLNTFLEGEQLKAIPASRKKRQVILEWLVNKLRQGLNTQRKKSTRLLPVTTPTVPR